MTLVQTPIFGDSVKRQNLYKTLNHTLHKNESISVSGTSTGVFDIEVEFTLSPKELNSRQLQLSILSNKVDGAQEEIKLGYDANVEAFYVDRGVDNEFNENVFSRTRFLLLQSL